MTANEYQELAGRTDNSDLDLAGCALGVTGEAGEFADLVKKWEYHGKAIDLEQGAKELGDVCWYIARAAKRLGYTFEQILEMNIAKLRLRYPQGFSAAASAARVDELPQERRWDCGYLIIGLDDGPARPCRRLSGHDGPCGDEP